MNNRKTAGPVIRAADIRKAIRLAADRVLADEPEAPVKVRLLRDVLQVPSNNADLRAATAALDDHPHVMVLAAEQRADGG